jgi:hypothetical protein
MTHRPTRAAQQAHGKLRNADQLGRGIAVTWSAPTPERHRKSADWSVEDRAGGLKVYRGLSIYDRALVDGHFSRKEQDAALYLLRDLEFSGAMKVDISRYDGMPHYPPAAGGYALRSQAQWEVIARLEWVLGSMAAGWHYLLWVLVVGVYSERIGKFWNIEELASRLCRYQGKDQIRAFLVASTKCSLMRLAEAYAAWPREKQRREEARKLRQAEKAIVKVQTEWAAERERAEAKSRSLLLQAYDRVVLGKRRGSP